MARQASNLNIPCQVIEWLQANFLEDAQGAIKKADLYADYEQFCEGCRLRPKDPNTFGKYVLRVFPSAYPSRLGSILDGSQAHCYSGISRRRKELYHVNINSIITPGEPMNAMEIEDVNFTHFLQANNTQPELLCDSPRVDPELEALVEAMLAEADMYITDCFGQALPIYPTLSNTTDTFNYPPLLPAPYVCEVEPPFFNWSHDSHNQQPQKQRHQPQPQVQPLPEPQHRQIACDNSFQRGGNVNLFSEQREINR